MKFSKFFTLKFIEWQHSQGDRKNVEDFAVYLGIAQSTASSYMNGKRLPEGEILRKISNILGLEVYDALDLPRPNPYLHIVNRLWDFIPEEIQKRISEEAEKFEAHDTAVRVQKASKPRKTKHAH